MEQLNTVGFYGDSVKEFFNQTSDDTNLEDLLIYKVLMDTRMYLIDQELTNNKNLDATYTQSVCLDLCQDTFAECCSLDGIGDLLLKSKKYIPTILSHKNIVPIKVRTVDGRNTFSKQPIENMRFDRYWDIPLTPTYDISNFGEGNRLLIFNTLTLRSVILTAVFEDPASAGLLNNCPGEDDDEDCIDWKDVTFPIPPKLNKGLMDIVLKRIAGRMQFPVDESNNAESSQTEL